MADHLKSDNIVGINIGYENGQKYLLRGRYIKLLMETPFNTIWTKGWEWGLVLTSPDWVKKKIS